MLTKTERFTLRLTPEDLRTLQELARKMERTPSDALRVLARQALRQLSAPATMATTKPTRQALT